MHVILGILTTLVTVLYLLDRFGFDLGGLNPFYWMRRRKFAKKYHADPVYSIEDPMEIAALLILGSARLGGDISAEQKDKALKLFESEFELDQRAANQLFGACAHLLAGPQLIDEQMKNLVERNTERFKPNQAEALVDMMQAVASAGSGLTSDQMALIDRARERLVGSQGEDKKW